MNVPMPTLSLCAGDTEPGDTMGQGLDAMGDRWHAAGADRAMITGD
jgi:hypothetical protein